MSAAASITLPPRPANLQWRHQDPGLCSFGRDSESNCASIFQREAVGTTVAAWYGSEYRKDPDGRVWSHSYRAVVNDFGDLVEVPR